MLNLAILTGLIVALIQVIKQGKFVDGKYLPLVAIALSFIIMFSTKHLGESNSEAIIQALVAALTAVGFYSSGKNVIQGLVK